MVGMGGWVGRASQWQMTILSPNLLFDNLVAARVAKSQDLGVIPSLFSSLSGRGQGEGSTL
jgi:hypothetical protein